jgi:hypothetical protein
MLIVQSVMHQSNRLAISLTYLLLPCLWLEISKGAENITTFAKDDDFDSYFASHYPDLLPPPPYNSKEDHCHSNLYVIASSVNYALQNITRLGPLITTTSVLEFETIESFGLNTTYTGCDGIPRLRFLSTPTRSHTSTVNITVWRDDSQYDFLEEEWGVFMSKHTTPYPGACDGIKLPLNPYYCRKLDGAGEVGGYGLAYGNIELPGIAQYCPERFWCRPTVREIVLIYWPDNVVSRDVCPFNRSNMSTDTWEKSRGSIFTTNAITFQGQDLYLRKANGGNFMTSAWREADADLRDEMNARLCAEGPSYIQSSVMMGNFSFTSPTIYLAHRPISRCLVLWPRVSTWFSQRELYATLPVRPEGVIPLNSTDVFSLRPIMQTMGELEYASLVAKGLYRPMLTRWALKKRYTTVPVNFNDLRDPVPANSYYDARLLECWGEQSHCGTLTDGSYRPKLRIATSVWKSIFNGYLCADPMLVDPPISLIPLRIGDQDVTSLPEPIFTTAATINFESNSLYSEIPQESRHTRRPRPGGYRLPIIPIETGLPKNRDPSGLPLNGVDTKDFTNPNDINREPQRNGGSESTIFSQLIQWLWRNGEHTNLPGDEESERKSGQNGHKPQTNNIDINEHGPNVKPTTYTSESIRNSVLTTIIWVLLLGFAGI